MRKIALWLVFLLSSPIMAQSNWTDQPKFAGIGLTIGYSIGNNFKPSSLSLTMGLGKLTYDIAHKQNPDPFTIMFGSYVGATIRYEVIDRKSKKNKTHGYTNQQ